MDNQALKQILAAYGVQGPAIGEPQKGYRNAAHRVTAPGVESLNLILYKTEPGILARIKNANAVGAAVAAADLPARTLADPRILQIAAGERRKFAAIYHYLPGKTIPWEAYTMNHLKQLGKTMSDMHEVLKSYNVANLPEVAQENLQLNRRMLRYFADPQVARAVRQKLKIHVAHADYTKLLSATQKLPSQQALHMDFVRGNILFRGTHITGILDFEKTAQGHTLYDIARTLAFLLVDCKYKPEDKIRKYFLHSGYIKRGAARLKDVKIGNLSLLEELTNFFLLHDFYKFLRHNPYESLPHNEHFVRTKAMLLKRRLIARV